MPHDKKSTFGDPIRGLKERGLRTGSLRQKATPIGSRSSNSYRAKEYGGTDHDYAHRVLEIQKEEGADTTHPFKGSVSGDSEITIASGEVSGLTGVSPAVSSGVLSKDDTPVSIDGTAGSIWVKVPGQWEEISSLYLAVGEDDPAEGLRSFRWHPNAIRQLTYTTEPDPAGDSGIGPDSDQFIKILTYATVDNSLSITSQHVRDHLFLTDYYTGPFGS